MSSLTELIRNNKQALLFLGKFVGLYIGLNTLYGIGVSYYLPAADPFTIMVSRHVGYFLSWFHDGISVVPSGESKNVAVQWIGNTIINVFEGCNGVNVWIVFTAFVVAFSRQWYKSWRFLLVGALVIYLINIVRVSMLFWVAHYFPDTLYFFHKFFFTAIIYAVVFVLWYGWVKKLRQHDSGNSTT
jgi:exosortase family protein XrtF